MAKDTIIFDIETQKSFDEVGGRDKTHLLGISVLGAYSYNRDAYIAFEEKELDGFKKMLDGAGLLVGFNIKGFDIPVLAPYVSLAEYDLAILDLMDSVVTGVGFRVSLDNLASNTLGITKSADGLQALRWYKEGKMDEIKKYCLQDVKVTKGLYEYGKKYGQILFYSRDKMRNTPISVNWGEPPQKDTAQILREAFAKRLSVEIGYPSAAADAARAEAISRVVDIYALNGDSFEGYCHLRKARRIFKIDKVVSAKLMQSAYKITGDVQHSLF